MADITNKTKTHTDESVSDMLIVGMLILSALTFIILLGIF